MNFEIYCAESGQWYLEVNENCPPFLDNPFPIDKLSLEVPVAMTEHLTLAGRGHISLTQIDNSEFYAAVITPIKGHNESLRLSERI